MYELNSERTSVQNQSTYDDTNYVVSMCVPYVMSLTRDYGCVMIISKREKTTALNLGRILKAKHFLHQMQVIY
jgi:hypothetical protein